MDGSKSTLSSRSQFLSPRSQLPVLAIKPIYPFLNFLQYWFNLILLVKTVNHSSRNCNIKKIKEWENYIRSSRPSNWFLGGWALVEPSMCIDNSQNKTKLDSICSWQKWIRYTATSQEYFFQSISQSIEVLLILLEFRITLILNTKEYCLQK